MSTLVIIDCDDHYLGKSRPYHTKVKNGVTKLINLWKLNNRPILFVEMGMSTIEDLTGLCNNYTRSYVVGKNQPDGSEQVISSIKKYNLSNDIHICGVNWDQCVQATIKGYLDLETNAKVYAYPEASNPACGLSKFFNWKDIKLQSKNRFKIRRFCGKNKIQLQ